MPSCLHWLKFDEIPSIDFCMHLAINMDAGGICTKRQPKCAVMTFKCASKMIEFVIKTG